MEQKTSNSRILGGMCKSIGKELTDLVRTGANSAKYVSEDVLIGVAYAMSLPLIGSLNHSANNRVSIAFQKVIGTEDYIEAGHRMADNASSISKILMPYFYGAISYNIRPDLIGFAVGFISGCIESAIRVPTSNTSIHPSMQYNTGTLIGSIIGSTGEKSLDYLKNKYEEARAEIEARK